MHLKTEPSQKIHNVNVKTNIKQYQTKQFNTSSSWPYSRAGAGSALFAGQVLLFGLLTRLDLANCFTPGCPSCRQPTPTWECRKHL